VNYKGTALKIGFTRAIHGVAVEIDTNAVPARRLSGELEPRRVTNATGRRLRGVVMPMRL